MMIISIKECQRGEFKVTKVVARRHTEVLEIRHGDPKPTSTVVLCRRKPGGAGLQDGTTVPTQLGWHGHLVPLGMA